MPRGSKYQGPAEALDAYAALVDAAGVELKGAKNPYTSCNGHMFSFLDPEGLMALRLSADDGAEFLAAYDSGPVTQYGRTMQGYVAVPDSMLDDPGALAPWFDRAATWIATLDPK